MSDEGTQNMHWGFQILAHAIIVRIFGDVNQTVSEMFEQAAERATRLSNRQVVIDFSDVESMNPIGLAFCGFGLHNFRQLGIPVALVKPPASLLPVLQEYGLPEIPPVFQEAQTVPNLN